MLVSIKVLIVILHHSFPTKIVEDNSIKHKMKYDGSQKKFDTRPCSPSYRVEKSGVAVDAN